MKHLRRTLFLGTTLLLAPAAALAQASKPTTPTPPTVQYGKSQSAVGNPVAGNGGDAASPLSALGPPIIVWLRGQGAVVEDLGNAHGLEGWLVMVKDEHNQNIFQTFYTTPDGQAVVAGIMFDDHGKDITGMQYALTAEGQHLITGNAAPSTATAPPASSPTATQQAQVSPQASLSPEAAAAAQVASVNTPEDVAPLGISDADFRQALSQTTFSFRVGDPKAPDLVMVADPHCPFCHKAWEYLAPLVKSHQIAVTVVLIHGLPEQESPLADAAAILSTPDPAAAWMKGIGSVQGVPIPPPTNQAAAIQGAKHISENDDFASEMQVSATPTVFWFQNGQTFRGQSLGSVIAFLKAVKAGGVES